MNFPLTKKNILWNQLFRYFFRKNSYFFTIFFTKKCGSNENSHSDFFWEKISWKQRFYQISYKRVDFTKYFYGESEFFVFPHCMRSLPTISWIRKTPVQWYDITGILIECIVFPAFVNQSFNFGLWVIKLDRFSQLSRSIGILWGRNYPFGMVFRVIFPPERGGKKYENVIFENEF